jgi:hypothetical protein
MLLCEVRPQLPTSNKKIQIPQMSKARHLGAGIQGFAKQLINKPNTVVKIALTANVDAYEEFIRLAMAHQDNPFFPKIKAVKKYKIDAMTEQEHADLMLSLGVSSDAIPDEDMLMHMNNVIIIAMERLIPIHANYLRDEVPRMLIDLYGDHVVNMLRRDFGDDVTEDIDLLLYALVKWSNTISKRTPNKHFRNILRLMAPLWQKWYKDTKADNMMIRQTPNGPQLVFLDPVWSPPAGMIPNNRDYMIAFT